MLRRALAACLSVGLWAHAPSQAHAAGVSRERVSHALRELNELTHTADLLPLDERVAFVNNSINQRVAYATDEAQWGEADRWQTPAETLALARGDCEDFAIAKYFVLHGCAAACDCARLLYAIHTPVDLPGLQSPHIVLVGAGTLDDPLVFDNLNPLLLRVSQRTDLQPVLSFDVSGLWRGVSGDRVGDAAALLRPWRELLKRWKQQHGAPHAG